MRCAILYLTLTLICTANLAAQEPSVLSFQDAVIQGKQITGVPATGEFEV